MTYRKSFMSTYFVICKMQSNDLTQNTGFSFVRFKKRIRISMKKSISLKKEFQENFRLKRKLD